MIAVAASCSSKHHCVCVCWGGDTFYPCVAEPG